MSVWLLDKLLVLVIFNIGNLLKSFDKPSSAFEIVTCPPKVLIDESTTLLPIVVEDITFLLPI